MKLSKGGNKMTKENLFPITIEDEADYILFKLYQHEIEEEVWEEYLKEVEDDEEHMELTKEEVKARDLFGKTYRGFQCIRTLLPIELGYTKNRETRFDDMYQFSACAYGYGECWKEIELTKEVVVKLIKDGLLKYHGGGCNLMAKKKVYDQSWGISPKGIKYCEEKRFDKLLGRAEKMEVKI